MCVFIAKMLLKPSSEHRFKVELQWHVAVGSHKQTQIEVVVCRVLFECKFVGIIKQLNIELNRMQLAFKRFFM